MPEDILKAHLGGRLMALKKADGGVRPLSCGSILRRIIARAVCKVEADALRELGGPHQYGISRPAGVEVMHKILVASAEERPAAAFLSFDCKNAFNMITRPAIRAACAGTFLGHVADVWYRHSSTHWFWDSSGKAWPVQSARGVDQGCPLSPGLFCAALAPALASIDQRLRALDPQARVYAYLDDIFVVIDTRFAADAVSATREALQGIGLELQLTRSKLWVPDTAAPAPAQVAIQRVSELRCLGNAMHFSTAALDADDQHRLGAPLAPDSRFEASLETLDTFLGKVLALLAKGLRVQTAFVLLRTFVGGANNHLLRVCFANDAWCAEYDNRVVAFLRQLLDTAHPAAAATGVAAVPGRRLGVSVCRFDPECRVYCVVGAMPFWRRRCARVALCRRPSGPGAADGRCPDTRGG